MPKSLWAATAPPAPATPALVGDVRADVAVIGGGFTGLSAALHLAEAGAGVAVLEAGEPGWGASGRNGGQVIAGLKHDPDELVTMLGHERGERLTAFAGGAADLVFDLIARHRIDCHADRAGWVQAGHGPKAMHALERRVTQWRRRGASVELLSAAEVGSLTGTGGYRGAMLDRRGGTVQPLTYARGLARAAQTAGAAVHGGSPAIGIEARDGAWRVATPAGAVMAEQVLLCANAYTDAVWPGLARSVIPAFSYQVATRPLGGSLRAGILPQGHAVSETRRVLRYFRLDPGGRLVLGGRGPSRETEAPGSYRGVVRALRRLYPRLSGVELDYVWYGQVALTLDHLPHLHELAPGVTAGLGYNGRGVAMAIAVGKLLAERAQGRPLADLPLPPSRLRPIRFHGLRRPALAGAVAWKRMLDGLDSWR